MIHFNTTRGPITMPNRDPEHATISGFINYLIQQAHLSDQSEDISLFFEDRKIETDQQLQESILNGFAGCIHDPIQVIFNNNINATNTQSKCIEKAPDLLDFFQFHENQNPHAIASTYGKTSLTNSELDQRANQMAQFLRKNYKTGPNIPIAIMGSNKLERLICMLAILKTGSAFVPFEPDIPKERLTYTLNNCKAQVIIVCDENSKECVGISKKISVLSLNEKREKILAESTDSFSIPKTKPNDLAYILYTSGSTANHPKGVMQTRAGLAGQIRNYTENLNLTCKDRFLQLAPFSHDQAIVDIFGALLNGAQLHLYDMDVEHFNVNSLQAFIMAKEISIFSSIPSVFAMLFENVKEGITFPSLRIVTLGGETVKKSHVQLYQKIAPSTCLFVNGYGATEFSWISYFIIKKDDPLDQMDQIPLGILSTGTLAMLDTSQSDDPRVGELCVASPHMSIGYWQNVNATKKAFVTHKGVIYYRTGDLAFKDESNVYHFKGRLCWHEKINGKRVNLKDVEDSMLKTFPFAECVVVSYGEDNKKLYAFYTVKKEAIFTLSEIEIRKVLKEFLKSHEIPFKFYALDEFPILQNAKVNRQALKRKIEAEIKEKQEQFVYSPQLTIVDQLFCDFLQLSPPLNEEFNFIEMGANSRDVIQFLNKLNGHLEKRRPVIQVEVNEFYADPTKKGLEDLIVSKYQQVKEDAEVAMEQWSNKLFEINRTKNELTKYQLREIFNYDYYFVQSSVYRDVENKTVDFNFAGLKVIANHYNEKHGIKIMPCESYYEFFYHVKEFIKSAQAGQIALTLPRKDKKDDHPTSCIFQITEGGKRYLFIADSVGYADFGLSYPLSICENLDGLDMHFLVDPYRRQKDDWSCMIETMEYLKNGLRLDMSKEILIIPRYQVSLEVQKRFPEPFQFFQSPIELLKHTQSLDFPQGLYYPIDQTAVLKTSSKKITLEEYRKKNIQPTRFVLHKSSKYSTSGPANNEIQEEQNNSLYKKTEKYIKIFDEHNSRTKK